MSLTSSPQLTPVSHRNLFDALLQVRPTYTSLRLLHDPLIRCPYRPQGGRVAYHGPRQDPSDPYSSPIEPPVPYPATHHGRPPPLPPPTHTPHTHPTPHTLGRARRDGVLAHFARLGHACPPHTNAAEFLVDLVSADTTTPAAAAASAQRIDRLVEAFEQQEAVARGHGQGHGQGLWRGPGRDKAGAGGPVNVYPTAFPPPTPTPPGARGVTPSPARLVHRSFHRFRLLLGRALRQVRTPL